MFPFAEFLNHLPVEGRNVIGFATSYESTVNDDFLIDPIGTRILHIGLNRRPGRQPAAAYDVSVDQNPGAVTNCRNRLFFLKKYLVNSNASGVERS